MRGIQRKAAVSLCGLLLLSSCSSAHEDVAGTATSMTATVVPSTTFEAPASTTSTPASTVTAATSSTTTSKPPPGLIGSTIVTTWGVHGPVDPNESGDHGSGCQPGEVLEDGIWFGQLLDRVVTAEMSELRFDVGCRRTNTSSTFTVYNEIGEVHVLAMDDATEFAHFPAASDGEVLALGTAAETISETMIKGWRTWGWALVQNGELEEFYVVNDYHHTASPGTPLDAATTDLLYPETELGVGPDGFDGSGCEPHSPTLPDGVWYGTMTSDTTVVEFDLHCIASDPDKWDDLPDQYIEDRAYGDNGDETIYTIPVEPDAPWYITGADFNAFPIKMTRNDARLAYKLEHGSGLVGWIRVVAGVVVVVYEPFEV